MDRPKQQGRAAVPAGYVTPSYGERARLEAFVLWDGGERQTGERVGLPGATAVRLVWRPHVYLGVRALAATADVHPNAVVGALTGLPVERGVLRAMLAARSHYCEPDRWKYHDAFECTPETVRSQLSRLAAQWLWPHEPYWTPRDLAGALGISRRAAERACGDGEIPALPKRGRGKGLGQWLVPQWLARDACHVLSRARKLAQGRVLTDLLSPCPDAPGTHVRDADGWVTRCRCDCLRCRRDHAVHRGDVPRVRDEPRPSNWGDAREFAADRRRVVAFVGQHAPRQDRAVLVAAYDRLAPRLPQRRRAAERPLARGTVETLAHSGEVYEPEDD